MDFIVHLPMTTEGNDQIMVVVDRLTKMVILTPCSSHATSRDIARHFFKNVTSKHGIPKEIVSDRDSRFTSNFWIEFTKMLRTNRAMSTAFHPQTDGQTERMNRTVEQILRIYADYHQTNWEENLPYVEFAINNTENSSTGETPFYLNKGLHPATHVTLDMPSTNPAAHHDISEIQVTINIT